MNILQDNCGRTFSYLRLSVTDACNFRCKYCLPNGYIRRSLSGEAFEDTTLNLQEILNLVSGFAALGFTKVRLTGGEPTLRSDIIEIVRAVSKVPGIRTVALTTNGYRLDKLARPLKEAGLKAINVSLDSLDEERFQTITGSRNFGRVKDGIYHALDEGIERVKINVVLLKSSILEDLKAYVNLARKIPVSIRFIELMETGDNTEFFHQEHISGEELRKHIEGMGWIDIARSNTDGPAQEFIHSEYLGKLGIIAPYSKDFCRNCNRLRVSSRGKIRLCLFGDGEFSIRDLLQSPNQKEELTEMIRDLIGKKAPSHLLHQGIFGSTQHLAAIGG